jgi:hypothetical protein
LHSIARRGDLRAETFWFEEPALPFIPARMQRNKRNLPLSFFPGSDAFQAKLKLRAL